MIPQRWITIVLILTSWLNHPAAEAASLNGGYGAAGSGPHLQTQPSVKRFLPDRISQSDKLRAFLECRRECIAKCDRLVYIYADKKEFCHDCIRQCMMSFLQQAKSLGIEFNAQPASSKDQQQMQGDAPASGGSDHRDISDKERRRRNRRKQRRLRRQKERQQRQALLKNCIVH